MLTTLNASSVRGWLVPALLLFLSQGGALATAHPWPQGNSEQEQNLRTRVQEFYSILQTGNWTKAEPYLTADSVETFRMEKSNTFAGFEIQSLKLEPDGASANVQVQVKSLSPLFPTP